MYAGGMPAQRGVLQCARHATSVTPSSVLGSEQEMDLKETYNVGDSFEIR
jgi:hypothetical protein